LPGGVNIAYVFIIWGDTAAAVSLYVIYCWILSIILNIAWSVYVQVIIIFIKYI